MLCSLVAHSVGRIAVKDGIWIVEASSAGLPGVLSESMSGPGLRTNVWRLRYLLRGFRAGVQTTSEVSSSPDSI